MKNIWVVIFIFVMTISVIAEKTKKVVNWILEDPTPKDGWDFSKTWQSEFDRIGTAGEYNNLLVSRNKKYKGDTSLQISINHKKDGYCGVWIPTGVNNQGVPPQSLMEVNQDKDISSCDTLEFYIKGVGKSETKNIKIEITDANSITTDKIYLVDYITPAKKWQKVQVPLSDFRFNKGFNKKQVRGLSFLIEQNDPPGKYILFIDNLRFISLGKGIKKRFKIIYEDTSAQDGAWNYSGSWEGNGSIIEKSSHYDNMPISVKEKYQGYNCFKFHVTQKPGGYAGCYLSVDSEGKGIPPKDWDEYNTPKDISSFNAMQLWVKGMGNANAKIEFTDTDKNASDKINLLEFSMIDNKWKKIKIPFKSINWQNFNKKKFKEIKLMIDDDHPEGEFTLYIDNFELVE